MNYTPNFQAEQIAAKVVAEHHPHLRKTRIAHLFAERDNFEETGPKKPEPAKPGKAIKIATASKVQAKYEPLLEENYQFLIVYDRDVWEFLELSQHEAVVDHELTHCMLDEDGKPYIRDHDVEEFRSILERHGFWRDGLRQFVEAAQGELFEAAAK